MTGYRTILFNICSFLAGLGSLNGVVLPEEALPYVALATALGNIGLRFLTTTPAMKAFGFVLPFLLVGIGMSGCSASQIGGGTPQATPAGCTALQNILAPRLAAYDNLCAQAKDPLTDDKCLARDGINVAIEACWASAGGRPVAVLSSGVVPVSAMPPGHCLTTIPPRCL